LAITSYLCKRLFCVDSHRTLGKSPQSTRPCLQFRCSELVEFGKFRRECRLPKLTCPSLQCSIPVRRWAWHAAVRDYGLCTEGWWPGSCANNLDCAVARRVARPAGFRDKSGRPAAFCAAKLGGARVGTLGMSSKFGFEPAGEAEKVVRSRGRSWWSSGFSTQKSHWSCSR